MCIRLLRSRLEAGFSDYSTFASILVFCRVSLLVLHTQVPQQQPAAAAPQMNPFAAMMMNPAAFGGGGGFGFPQPFAPQAPVAPQQQPEVLYATQLRQLQEMGFYDQAANIRALVSTGGDVNAALSILFG